MATSKNPAADSSGRRSRGAGGPDLRKCCAWFAHVYNDSFPEGASTGIIARARVGVKGYFFCVFS